MTLNKAIDHGKEKREHYRHSKAFDKSCRNHGGCPYCENGRVYRSKKRVPASEGIDMHNLEQARADAEQLYNDAVQNNIRDVLKHDGPSYCGQVASAVDKPVQETRWHLENLVSNGEIDYSLTSGRYSV